jgi:hypothetical protein
MIDFWEMAGLFVGTYPITATEGTSATVQSSQDVAGKLPLLFLH